MKNVTVNGSEPVVAFFLTTVKVYNAARASRVTNGGAVYLGQDLFLTVCLDYDQAAFTGILFYYTSRG